MPKKLIFSVVQILLIVISSLVGIFLISIPYEASLIKFSIPSPSQFSYSFSNGTLIIYTNTTIVNNGIYDLNDLSLFVAAYTLSGFQIASFYEGPPYMHINIKANSYYVLPIKIPINILAIVNTNLLSELMNEKNLQLYVSVSGRYAFNLLSFNIATKQIIPFQPPIQNISIDTSKLLNPSFWVVNNSGIFIPIGVNYEGTIQLNNIMVKGTLTNSSGFTLISFSSNAVNLRPGYSEFLLKVNASKSAFIELFTRNQTLKINFQIISNYINFSKEITYNWIVPVSLSVENIILSPIINNKTSLYVSFVLKNNINSNIVIKGKLVVYNNSTNSFLNQTSINLSLNPQSLSNYVLGIVLNNVNHGNIITFELFLTYPINIEYPLLIESFILP